MLMSMDPHMHHQQKVTKSQNKGTKSQRTTISMVLQKPPPRPHMTLLNMRTNTAHPKLQLLATRNLSHLTMLQIHMDHMDHLLISQDPNTNLNPSTSQNRSISRDPLIIPSLNTSPNPNINPNLSLLTNLENHPISQGLFINQNLTTSRLTQKSPKRSQNHLTNLI